VLHGNHLIRYGAAMHIDILIYAVVALVLLSRLWSMFGQKDDGDGPPVNRPNPFATKENTPIAINGASAVEPPILRVAAAPESLAGGIEQIRKLDGSFDEKKFLQGARAAFTMIVEEFGRGDLARSATLLGGQVLSNFQAAITERRNQGHVLESKVARIRDADVMAVKMEASTAFLTVRFISEQENILRDQMGKVVTGQLGALEEITDLWIFSRDLKSTDPNWRLVETRHFTLP
jgi:predicted lipid-binding transport protein (Tim44 family)